MTGYLGEVDPPEPAVVSHDAIVRPSEVVVAARTMQAVLQRESDVLHPLALPRQDPRHSAQQDPRAPLRGWGALAVTARWWWCDRVGGVVGLKGW